MKGNTVQIRLQPRRSHAISKIRKAITFTRKIHRPLVVAKFTGNYVGIDFRK